MSIQSTFSARQLAAAAATVAALAAGMVVGSGSASAAQPSIGSATLANNVLTIHGTSGEDAITVALAANDATTVVVDFGNGNQYSFPRSSVSSITAFLGAGNDQFFDEGTADVFTAPATVFGGAGNDSITGGDGNDTLYGEAGNDEISGGDGVDTIFGGNGNDLVDGNKGNDSEYLGSGRDVAFWAPGEASDVVDGGSDADDLVFDGASGDETMSLTANGSHAKFFRVQGNVTMDLVGVEGVNVDEFAGADAFTVGNLAGTDVTRVNVDLGSDDGATDAVTVDGTSGNDNVKVGTNSDGAVAVTGLAAITDITSAEPADHLQVNAQGGHDKVDVTKKASSLLGVNVTFGVQPL